MTFYQNGGRVFFSQSMATQADDKSPMVWTSEDIIDVFVLNSNLLNKHKHKQYVSILKVSNLVVFFIKLWVCINNYWMYYSMHT